MDVLGQSCAGVPATHVGIGATLFRRDALDLVTFRWEPGRCECICCCDDLRKQLIGIDYADGLVADHVDIGSQSWAANNSEHLVPCIFAQVRRSNVSGFMKLLRELRGVSTGERLLVDAVELSPSQLARLRVAGVEIIPKTSQEQTSKEQPMSDTIRVLDGLHSLTPIGYFQDFGEVSIECSLSAIWTCVSSNPSRVFDTEALGQCGLHATDFIATTASNFSDFLSMANA